MTLYIKYVFHDINCHDIHGGKITVQGKSPRPEVLETKDDQIKADQRHRRSLMGS